MSYHIIFQSSVPFQEQEKVHKLLDELKLTVPFTRSEQGNLVLVSKIEKGISIKKEGNQRFLAYDDINSFARAWFLMLQNEEQATYEVKQEGLFQHLTLMLDCSRNAVMKPEVVKELIRQLACMGYTALQLYTEDTYEIKQEPYFGYMRGAYTKEEIREIDRYCQMFGMELVPCIQTLAHLNQITQYDNYQKLIDLDDILLVDEEKTYELIEHMIQSVKDSFRCKKINIGMDEAYRLGRGEYLQKHGYHERTELMIRHLKRVLELLHKYGFHAQMWSDMFIHSLEKGAIIELPKDVELIYWDYYSLDQNHYEELLNRHFQLSDQINFAAGAWKWTGFAPDNAFSQLAGRAAVDACAKYPIKEFIVTSWGDNGGEAGNFSVLPTLYRYAQMVYGGYEDKGFQLLTKLSFDDFMKLELVNTIVPAKVVQHGNSSKYFLYNDPLLGTFDSLVPKDVKDTYLQNAKILKRIADEESPYAYLFETMAKLCDVLALKADLGLALRDSYQAKDQKRLEQLAQVVIPELIHQLDAFLSAFKIQWHRENKPFGFEVQLIRIGGLKERLRDTKERIELFLNGAMDQIEELEAQLLPFAYRTQTDVSQLIYNDWRRAASPSNI